MGTPPCWATLLSTLSMHIACVPARMEVSSSSSLDAKSILQYINAKGLQKSCQRASLLPRHISILIITSGVSSGSKLKGMEVRGLHGMLLRIL